VVEEAPLMVLDTLQERGFWNQCTDETGLRRRMEAGPLAFYIGFDPTADSLHAGSLVQLMAMAHLSRAGHHAIAVVGGGTARVGDPSGRDETRELLDDQRLEVNKRGIAAQIARFCQGRMVDNAEWLMGLGYVAFLRDIGRHFSVNNMLTAESVRARLERNQGLSFIEFNYALLQAYDFLELYRRHGCVLQVGGGDQWYNIVCGMDLIRRLEGGQSWGLTTPLLTTVTGAKMGKTARGAVWLDPVKVPPYAYFQYWMNVDDRDVVRFSRLFTFTDVAEIDARAAADVRAAKRSLAREATAILHGEPEAAAADEAAAAAFAGGVASGMPTLACPLPIALVDVLVNSGLAKSKGEARRLIQQGGVSVGDDRVDSLTATVEHACVVWAGKKRAVRVCPA
jgi:tyrosyl-tRNA synthetase